jgi:hypothetical protein
MPAPLRSRAVLVGIVVGLPLSAFFFWLAFRNADVSEVWSVLTLSLINISDPTRQ